MKKPPKRKSPPTDQELLAYLRTEARLAEVAKNKARHNLSEAIKTVVDKMEASGKLTIEDRIALHIPPQCWNNIAPEEECER